MHRHAGESRRELQERRCDRGRRHRHLDAALQEMRHEQLAHLVPFLAGLVVEEIVERIRLRASAQVIERAARARRAELRIDGLADGIEIVAHHESLARLHQRIERVADERGDDDRLDVEFVEDLRKDPAIFDAVKQKVDTTRLLKMIILHDLVEAEATDISALDVLRNPEIKLDKVEKEKRRSRTCV